MRTLALNVIELWPSVILIGVAGLFASVMARTNEFRLERPHTPTKPSQTPYATTQLVWSLNGKHIGKVLIEMTIFNLPNKRASTPVFKKSWRFQKVKSQDATYTQTTVVLFNAKTGTKTIEATTKWFRP